MQSYVIFNISFNQKRFSRTRDGWQHEGETRCSAKKWILFLPHFVVLLGDWVNKTKLSPPQKRQQPPKILRGTQCLSWILRYQFQRASSNCSFMKGYVRILSFHFNNTWQIQFQYYNKNDLKIFPDIIGMNTIDSYYRELWNPNPKQAFRKKL